MQETATGVCVVVVVIGVVVVAVVDVVVGVVVVSVGVIVVIRIELVAELKVPRILIHFE